MLLIIGIGAAVVIIAIAALFYVGSKRRMSSHADLPKQERIRKEQEHRSTGIN
jgi:hypothetical protein